MQDDDKPSPPDPDRPDPRTPHVIKQRIADLADELVSDIYNLTTTIHVARDMAIDLLEKMPKNSLYRLEVAEIVHALSDDCA